MKVQNAYMKVPHRDILYMSNHKNLINSTHRSLIKKFIPCEQRQGVQFLKLVKSDEILLLFHYISRFHILYEKKDQ